jgi:cytosine/adenosine deaminase-related metal-dependent hydrolase
MTTLLLKNAEVLVTMDAARREIAGGGLFARDGVIEQVGPTAQLPATADTVLDLRGHVVLPGLVNTHHHLFQSLTRAVPAAQDAALFDWLRALLPLWVRLTPEALYTATLTGLAELLLAGCTTAADHHYCYPDGVRLDDQIQAAREIGLRFHALRGSVSIGESQGGITPDAATQPEELILSDSRRLIETYHDPSRFALLRVALAPGAIFSVSRDLMRASAEMARSYGVRLHTHLLETIEDVTYAREVFGKTAIEYAQEVGWIGDDVWFAHCVHLDDGEIELFARSGAGVCHCPTSNMRLGSGIARVRRMLDCGVRVGLGVDGSASNDTGHLLAEARQALLLQRVCGGPGALKAREALEIATLGGARVLGRDDIGALAPGLAADVVAWDLNQIGFAGSLADPVAALILCQPVNVSYAFVQGRLMVDRGQLTTIDLPLVLERHNALSRALLNGAP